MPQSSNVLSFVPALNSEFGPRLNASDAPRPWPAPTGVAEEAALRKIAEAALSATGASGAALALRRNGSVLCLARAGEMAPPLGARLDDHSGISGECLREGHALCCHDTETDTRVDAEACRSLGLRSLAVAAVRNGDQIIGILEVFSPHPAAFTERHMEVLRQLAELVLESTETVVEQPGLAEPAAESTPLELTPLLAKPADKLLPNEPMASSRSSLVVTSRAAVDMHSAVMPATPLPGDVNIAAYMAAHEKAQSQLHSRVPKLVLVGLATVLFASIVGWSLGHRKSRVTATVAAAQPVAPYALVSSGAETVALVNPIAKPSPDVSAAESGESKAERESLTNAASLDRIANATHRVTKPIRVVRNAPATDAGSDTAPQLVTENGDGKPNETVSSLLNTPLSLPQRAPPISQGVEGGELESKVAALYPAQARAVGQHGTVVLQALVAEDGSVRDVKIVSGPPLLRQAAADAVKRWRYKPYKLNGHPIAAQTEIKLEFKLN